MMGGAAGGGDGGGAGGGGDGEADGGGGVELGQLGLADPGAQTVRARRLHLGDDGNLSLGLHLGSAARGGAGGASENIAEWLTEIMRGGRRERQSAVRRGAGTTSLCAGAPPPKRWWHNDAVKVAR